MSWFSDIFLPSTAQTSGEAQANFDRQKAELAQAIADRQVAAAAGTAPPLSPDTLNQDQALLQEQLSSQDLAAAIGAVQGATEIAYDPSQWAKDTAAGATMVANGASAAYDKASNTAWALFWAGFKKFFGSKLGWMLIVAGAIGLFIWMGGLEWLAFRTKGRLARRHA